MKRIFLHWFPVVTLIASLNLLSCGSSGGEESSSTGPLDGKFGKGGKVTTAIGSIDDEAYGLVIQSDGKLVAAGYTNYGSDIINGPWKFALVRYNTDGTLDTSFGTGGTGIVTTDINGIDDKAFALVIQSDGKLVAAGYTDMGGQYEFALVRYNTDGTLDTSFGTGGTGIVTTAIGTVDDEAFALAIQTDDKLVAAGYSYNGSQRVFALVRYNTNGTLDTSFSTNGIVTTRIGSKDQAFALGIQTNGKLVAAGFSKISPTGANEFALVRYETNGNLDTSFGVGGFGTGDCITGGCVTTPIGNGVDNEIRGIALQPNGKLVASGFSNNGSQYVFTLVRYNTDGSLDPSFGLTGIVTTASAPLGKSNFAYALALQPNGKLVTAGSSSSGNQNQGVFVNKFAVVRYNPTGSQDDTFSSKGIAVTSIDNFDDEAFAVALETMIVSGTSKTKQVTAGKSYDKTTGTYQFALIRYAPSKD